MNTKILITLLMVAFVSIVIATPPQRLKPKAMNDDKEVDHEERRQRDVGELPPKAVKGHLILEDLKVKDGHRSKRAIGDPPKSVLEDLEIKDGHRSKRAIGDPPKSAFDNEDEGNTRRKRNLPPKRVNCKGPHIFPAKKTHIMMDKSAAESESDSQGDDDGDSDSDSE